MFWLFQIRLWFVLVSRVYADLEFFCFLTNLNKAIIAAGVTPEILEAAPSVGGCIVDNFSIISLDKLPIFL